MAAFDDQKHPLCLFFALFFIATVLLCPTHALTLDVGGSEGWNVDPPEDYNSWAAVMRFSVNDTLHFKYDRTIDSVLEVSEEDYDKCNVNNPIVKMDDGASAFTLNHSGPFHFISGNKSHCDRGQKMIIIVLSDQHKRQEQVPSAPPVASPTNNASSSSPAPLPAAAISQAPAPATTATAASPSTSPTPSASSSPTTIPSDISTPAPSPAEHSGGSTASTVSFVIISLALAGFISSS